MSPEERQMLTGLFDRIRGAAATPRDPEAEALISDAVRNMPYAPYLLAQAVIVQDQALQAANGKLQEQEAQLHELEQQIEQQQPRQSTGGGFLGGLGSIFGSHPAPEPPASSVPPSGPWGQQAQQPSYRQPHEPPPSGNPWAGAPGMGGGMGGSMGAGMGSPTMGGPGMGSPGMGAPMGGGGGFLKGALGAAAGVAGGVLLADSIRGLFGAHNNPLGISTGMGGLGSGLGGLGSGLGTGSGGETTINNYYDSPSSDANNAQDQDGTQEASYDDNDDNDDNYGDDDSNDDSDNGDDGSYDV